MKKVLWCLMVVLNVECMVTVEADKQTKTVSWAPVLEVYTFKRKPGESDMMWGQKGEADGWSGSENKVGDRTGDATRRKARVPRKLGASIVAGGQYGSWMAACWQSKDVCSRSIILDGRVKEAGPVITSGARQEEVRILVNRHEESEQKEQTKATAIVAPVVADLSPIVCVEQAIFVVAVKVQSLVLGMLRYLWEE